jgi:hypothetical protein
MRRKKKLNKSETAKIMATLKMAYPQYYKNMSADELDAAVRLWQDMFDSEPYAEVAAGIKAFMASESKGFPPSIGQVKEKIALLTRPQDAMTEQEAWTLVKKALRNSAYGYLEEYEKLPEAVKSVIGSPSVLREWGQVDMRELDTVVASNFMRSYRARVQHEREYAALPESVKQFANAIAERVARFEDRGEFRYEIYQDNYDHKGLEEIIRAKLENGNEQQG